MLFRLPSMVPSHSSGLSLSLELTLCLLQAWCIASMFPQPSIYSLSIVFIAHSQVQTPKEGRQEKKESSSLKEDNRRLKNQRAHSLSETIATQLFVKYGPGCGRYYNFPRKARNLHFHV